MILRKIRNKNIKKKIDKVLVSLNKPSFSDGKINSILIFSDEDTVKDSNQIIAKELSIDISKVESIIYIKKLANGIDCNDFLTDKDFDWLGKIKNERINNLVNSEYNLLVNLTNNNLLLDYLTVISRATFKVGFSSADNRLYDFMIEVDNSDVIVFSAELKKYLKILNKI